MRMRAERQTGCPAAPASNTHRHSSMPPEAPLATSPLQVGTSYPCEPNFFFFFFCMHMPQLGGSPAQPTEAPSSMYAHGIINRRPWPVKLQSQVPPHTGTTVLGRNSAVYIAIDKQSDHTYTAVRACGSEVHHSPWPFITKSCPVTPKHAHQEGAQIMTCLVGRMVGHHNHMSLDRSVPAPAPPCNCTPGLASSAHTRLTSTLATATTTTEEPAYAASQGPCVAGRHRSSGDGEQRHGDTTHSRQRQQPPPLRTALR